MLKSLQSRLDAIVTNPDLAPLLSLVKGIRNGAVYGAKVRFPHALVYVILQYSWCLRNYANMCIRSIG